MKRIIALVCLVAALVYQAHRVNMLKEESAKKTEILGGMSLVIHECWIKDSTEFQQTIARTEAFHYADSLVEGFWEDTFLNY